MLTALGEELGSFVEYVGGPEYGHMLLSPLENLPRLRSRWCGTRRVGRVFLFFVTVQSRQMVSLYWGDL